MRRWLAPALGVLVAVAAGLALLGAWWWTAEGPNHSEIEPGLHVGGFVTAPPRGTRFVLNLCEQEDPYTVEHHVHEPIADAAPAPPLEWLERMVSLVESHRGEGRTVFIHCRNGVSRSGMVAVAYLMREHGWTLDEALSAARRGRSILRPHPAFMGRLREWEQRLAGK